MQRIVLRTRIRKACIILPLSPSNEFFAEWRIASLPSLSTRYANGMQTTITSAKMHASRQECLVFGVIFAPRDRPSDETDLHVVNGRDKQPIPDPPARLSLYVPHGASIMNAVKRRHHFTAVPRIPILVQSSQQRSLVEVHRVVQIRRFWHDLPYDTNRRLRF